MGYRQEIVDIIVINSTIENRIAIYAGFLCFLFVLQRDFARLIHSDLWKAAT